jgi:hypothetical protein
MRLSELGKAKRLLFAILILVPTAVFADARKEDWYGAWAMNHDGHTGTLRIGDTKVDCAGPLWCDMKVSYVDTSGREYRGTILRIDDSGQHMSFQIDFPGNRQKFDAYIFSWQKTNLAGVTYWGGRTFGFYARK